MPGGRPQERLEFLGGPCLLLDLRDGAESRCVGNERDASGHQPSADGVAERAADDEVHLVGGLGRQGGATVARAEETLVEGFEVMGPQLPQADPAEGGQDVALHVAAVAVVGAGGQDEPLAGKPPGGQVGAEGERTGAVVATVALAGEPRCEPLGVSALGACGVPAPALPARNRVDSLVDDRVPAVALACDVPLHGASPSVATRVAAR